MNEIKSAEIKRISKLLEVEGLRLLENSPDVPPMVIMMHAMQNIYEESEIDKMMSSFNTAQTAKIVYLERDESQ